MKFLLSLVPRLSSLKGIFFGCLAGICYGTNPLGALNLYAEGLSPEVVLCYRFAFAAILLGATLLACRKSFKINKREFGVLLLLGFLFAVCAQTLFASFQFMDAGLASTLLFLYPLEVAVLMGLCFKEKLTAKTAVSIAVSLAGLALLYRGGESGAALSTVGLLLVFISSFSYAVYIIVVNKAELKMGSVKITFYAVTFCLFFMLLYATIFGSGFPPLPTTPGQWGWGLMLGFVPTYLSLVFMAKAIKIVGSTPTAITGALEPLTAVCIGVFVFGEAMTLRLAVGIALILASVVMISLRKH